MTIEPLVSADWLQQHLDDVVVIDGSYYLATMGKDADKEFEKSHIANAQRWNIDLIADRTSDLKHMMPSPQQVAAVAGTLGITRDTPVIVYDQSGMFSAARVWLTFKTIGHRAVALLDGGLPVWSGELQAGPAKKPVSVDYGEIEPDCRTVNRHEVLQALDSAEHTVLDARSEERFCGTAQEPVVGLEGGHMPSALNIPYTALLDENKRFKPLPELRQIFQRAGVDLEKQLITSCGSGVTASIVTFALYLMGKESVVYDGSWSEWGQPSLQLPVIKGF